MFVNATSTSIKQWGIPVLFFVLALAVRLPALDTFLTIDEPTWLYRSSWFLTGLVTNDEECPPDQFEGRKFSGYGLVCTFQPSYPGVTTMWTGTVGLLLHYWQTADEYTDLPTASQSLRTFDGNTTSLITSVRLPTVVISALFVAVFFLLLRRLLDERVAVVAALLVALSPFHAGQSRILHTDALITTFMVLSVLALLGYWLQGWRWYWLVFSGVMGGMALLTKPSSWFLAPFFVLLGLFILHHRWHGWSTLWSVVRDGVVWIIVAGVTIFVSFPAMWLIPLKVLQNIFWVSSGMALAGHSHFFLGKITDDPGTLYYPLGWILRSSPLELLGITALGILVLGSLWRYGINYLRHHITKNPVQVALFLFALSFFLFVIVSPKKFIRYALPAFPIIDVFVAYGLLWLWDKFTSFNFTTILPGRNYVLYGLVFLFQSVGMVTSFPYYLVYFNPILGGAPTASQLMDIGWGEGADKAAAYLNQLPNAADITANTCLITKVFSPFFSGKETLPCRKAEYLMAADYIVYYRGYTMITDSPYWPYFRDHQEPVYRANIGGVDYALVYGAPFEHRISPIDNRLTGQLTVYGYNFETDGAIKLVWHNVAGVGQNLVAGLASPVSRKTYWTPCRPAPGFETASHTEDAFVESICSLSTANAPEGLYDVQLALGNGSDVHPIASSGVTFVSISPAGIDRVSQKEVLQQVARQTLPKDVLPTDSTYTDRMRLIGYRLNPGTLTLYWQPIRRPDIGLAQAFQLDITLLTMGNTNPLASIIQPLFTRPVNPATTPRGAIIPIDYVVPQLPDADALTICLKIGVTGQVVPAIGPGERTEAGCIQLPISQPGAGQP